VSETSGMLIVEQLDTSEGGRWREIRLASLRDAPDAYGTTLAEVEFGLDEYWTKQVNDLPTWVAVMDGVDTGVVRAAASTEYAGAAFLLSLWVAPAERGRALATALIEAVISWAKSHGFNQLVLDVADYNTSASALYTRIGFVATGETGTLPAPRQHITEHRMALNLAE
jgi:GNAT superfamily N-acetyltransferase